MKPIPFIVGFGGLSAAGRSAFHIAYNRLVIEEIDKSDKLQTFASLAIMMNLVTYKKEQFYTAEASFLQTTRNCIRNRLSSSNT